MKTIMIAMLFVFLGEPVLLHAAPTDADFAAQVQRVRAALGEGFTVFESRPFVVAGDEAAATVRGRAQRTVQWAVRHLKDAYFEKDPDHIITIYLFRDAGSYQKHVKQLFGDAPDTPYGYYSPSRKALVMNIATGGGTLVHEMVHPFMAANFPKCPAWFNEGLASLYEQSAERGGKIVGLTNWRLHGLQKTIRAGELGTFKALTETNDHGFYKMDRGSNYAQARYLCYWLQEHDKLRAFYRQFVAAADDDPTGYNTLIKVIGAEDFEAFEKQWRAWVLTLRFNGL